MPFAILRTAKLKTLGEIGGSVSHTFRTRDTPNADPSRTHQNEHHGPSSGDEVMQGIRDRLPEKRRKNAVLVVEYFIGASPEFFTEGGNDGAYFQAAIDWLKDRHGAENVISAHVHHDETSPHLVAYVVPLDEAGKLNARKWLGGREALSAMQTDFADQVGRTVGLERGVQGSMATHQTIKDYYAKVEQGLEIAEGLRAIEHPTERQREKGVFSTQEADSDFARRVASTVIEQAAPALLGAREAVKQTKEAERRAQRAEKRVQQIQERERGVRLELIETKIKLDRWDALVAGLAPSDRDQAIAVLKAAVEKIRAAAKQVRGWFQGFRQDRAGEEWKIELQETRGGPVVTLAVHQAAMDLHKDQVQVGDLIEITKGRGKIVARAHDQSRENDGGLER